VVAGLRMIEREKSKIKPLELVPLVVAKAEIPFGAAISGEMLGTIEVNKLWAKGSHSKAEEVLDRVASARIVAGMPVTDEVLAPLGTPAGAENQIPMGYSLVPLEIESHRVQTLDPGNHVDVVHTPASVRGRTGQESNSRLIVQNVEVFAVGSRRVGAEVAAVATEATQGRRTAPPVRTAQTGDTSVTLLVPRDDAMTLTSLSGKAKGEFMLLLRRAGDDTVYEMPPVAIEVEAEQEAEKEKVVIAAPPPPPPPMMQDVVISIGGQQTTKTFVDGQLMKGPGGVPTAAPANRPSLDEGSRPKPLEPLGE